MRTAPPLGQSRRIKCDKTRERFLINSFGKYVTVVQANSKELLDKVFRLRFQVYCVERCFEDAAEYPDGRERDSDDARSTHFLVLYRPSRASEATAVGTVRLILPHSEADLPVFNLIKGGERSCIDLPLESTAEVSRFAIAKASRGELKTDPLDDLNAGGVEDWRPRSAFPLLSFGLIRAVVLMSAHSGITHIVAMMEPTLLRLLKRFGIEFNLIGDPVEHHGCRQPAWAAMAHLAEQVRLHYPALWEFATDAGRHLVNDRVMTAPMPIANLSGGRPMSWQHTAI
jgi:N-acyl amino acid synthase of PEP-CTERM/exosortase system